jgi:hypothetical protein
MQVGTWQTPFVQTPLRQSVGSRQTFLSAHFGQVPPPQSTSVSPIFVTPSLQDAGEQVPFVQTPYKQSVPVLHLRVLPHFGHVPPPQSTSVSTPFCTPSVHSGAWQTFPLQTPPSQPFELQTLLLQSTGPVQNLPSAHLAQVLVPPQSTSLSPWF